MFLVGWHWLAMVELCWQCSQCWACNAKSVTSLVSHRGIVRLPWSTDLFCHIIEFAKNRTSKSHRYDAASLEPSVSVEQSWNTRFLTGSQCRTSCRIDCKLSYFDMPPKKACSSILKDWSHCVSQALSIGGLFLSSITIWPTWKILLFIFKLLKTI